MIKKLNKKILIVAIISASASSVNANLIENTDITLRAGVSKQDFMFDTLLHIRFLIGKVKILVLD